MFTDLKSLALPAQLAAGVLLAAFGPAVAQPATLVVEVAPGGPDVAEGGVELQARVLESVPGGSSEPRRWKMPAPGKLTVELDTDFAWEVSARAQGYWAPARMLAAGGSTREVRFELLPTGRITGTFEPVQPPPARLEARFESAARTGGPSQGPKLERASTACTLADRGWSCELPAGSLDVRLKADEDVPVYFWAVAVRPQAVLDLGRVRRIVGGSVSGWIETAPEPLGAQRTTVELVPEIRGRTSPREQARIEQRSLTAEVRSNGFFQIAGVPPGSYVLLARRPGFALAQVPGVQVEQDRESALRQPVPLRRPAKLQVQIAPPVSPYGETWRVELLFREPITQGVRRVRDSEASGAGAWVAEGLAAGTYLLVVKDRLDSQWHHEEVEVQPPESTLDIHMPLVLVEGRIERGQEPVECTLWFGGTDRAQRIRMEANQDGELAGYLPREGLWPLEVVLPETGVAQALDPVEVKRAPGQRSARLSLVLPDTVLRGQVVDENGAAVPDALVVVLSSQEKKRREASLATDEKGEFTLRGLVPGTIHIQAQKGEARTDWTAYPLEERREGPPLRLVLAPEIAIAGRVVSAAGPVPGALLQATPLAVGAPATVATAVSSADGGFRLAVPRGALGVHLAVFPPGFAVRLLHLALGDGAASQNLELLVQPHGGVLRLDLPAGTASSLPSVKIVHSGAAAGLLQLLSGVGPQRREEDDGGDIALSPMEPGDYAVCAGASATAANCATGYLPPGGELVLRLPG